jgi:hypothetical protein
VSFEVTDTDDTTCPIELLEIPVPKCDPDFDVHCSGTKKMPYERIKYNKHTGRKQTLSIKALVSYVIINMKYPCSRDISC